MEGLVDDENGTSAVVVRDLRTGAAAAYHERDVFPAASLAKVPILVETHRLLRAGALRSETLVKVSEDAITDGAGVLQARAGDVLTVAELERLAVSVSDNVASRLLLQRVGGVAAVNRTMAGLGLRETRLYADERPNTTTAAEMAQLMSWIAGEGPGRGAPAAAMPAGPPPGSLAALLALPQEQAWIAERLPREVVVAHKSGQLPSLRHEAGILYTPRGPVVVVALTEDLADQDTAEAFIARLGREIYNQFA